MSMKVIDLIKKRYACKLFSSEKILEKDLNEILEAVRLAPSSFNLQPWKIKVVSEKEILKKLESASFNQKQIGTCSHLFVFCAMKDLDEHKEKLLKEMKEKMSEEKYIEYGKMLNQFFEHMSKEDLFRLSERENFIALENAILVSTELGYSSCPMGGFQTEKYSEILKLDDNLVPVVVLPMGIAKDESREKFRFKKEEIIF